MKILYNSLVPFRGFDAINLFGIILARKDKKSLDKDLVAHEKIHTRQQVQCFAIGFVLMIITIIVLGWWWTIILPFVFFYLLYIIEYAIRLLIYHNRTKAYYKISFEQEAYEFQRKWRKSLNGCKKPLPYHWLSFLFRR